MIKIVFEQYEKDFNIKLSKEKKREILKFFTKFSKLRFERDFRNFENILHKACELSDVDLIKIYLSETIQNDTKDLTFQIDKINRTASLIKVRYSNKKHIIPRTVQYESTEYIITSITGIYCDINTINFAEDSAIKTFYFGALSYADLEEIYFPASLKELKEGWCHWTKNLTKIIISPNNNQFIFKDNKLLLGKSCPDNDEFDVILFAARDIEEISIPSNIKIISSYAFEYCLYLNKVEIPPNSNLQIIGSFAFFNTQIEEIFIPPKVTKICKSAFDFCHFLTKVNIPRNSNLQTIETLAFLYINEIYFPAKLKELEDGWCRNVNKFCKIRISLLNNQFIFKNNKFLFGKSDPSNYKFDKFLLAVGDIEEISIPTSIKFISSCAFCHCFNLKKIKITPKSNLQTIGSFAFGNTKIEDIYFPAGLRKLKKGWCYKTNNLTKIIISPSNNQFIFKDNKILLGKMDPNSDDFDILLFAARDIKEISISSNIKKISSYAFDNCQKLIKVDISPNSNLQTIESNAFQYSNIKQIFIPSKVSKICENAFYRCMNLIKIEIPPNSNLQIIESHAFQYSNIEQIFIPSKVSKICVFAFFCCNNLKIIEISEESELESIPLKDLSYIKVTIMIPSSLRKLIQNK